MQNSSITKLVKKIKSTDDMIDLLPYSHLLSWYKPGRQIIVSDKMQKHKYTLTAPYGKLSKDFKPEISPAKMLKMGVFEGKYLNDCILEFPREWFIDALNANRLSPEMADVTKNAFKIKSRLSLQKWRHNKWIPIADGDNDIRGWFQWYCRYWIGRRIEHIDKIQIARYNAFTRHRGQILASYKRLGKNRPYTVAQKREHRPRQRQALLQWAYNPYV